MRIAIIVISFFLWSNHFYSAVSSEEKAGHIESDTVAITAIMDSNKVVLQNVQLQKIMEIYSIVGVKVLTKTIEKENQEFLLDLPKGYYILKIGEYVRKIVIK